MKLELTEEEAAILRGILDDEQFHALGQLDKATNYQLHDEMKKWRKRGKIADRLYKRLLHAK